MHVYDAWARLDNLTFVGDPGFDWLGKRKVHISRPRAEADAHMPSGSGYHGRLQTCHLLQQPCHCNMWLAQIAFSVVVHALTGVDVDARDVRPGQRVNCGTECGGWQGPRDVGLCMGGRDPWAATRVYGSTLDDTTRPCAHVHESITCSHLCVST